MSKNFKFSTCSRIFKKNHILSKNKIGVRLLFQLFTTQILDRYLFLFFLHFQFFVEQKFFKFWQLNKKLNQWNFSIAICIGHIEEMNDSFVQILTKIWVTCICINFYKFRFHRVAILKRLPLLALFEPLEVSYHPAKKVPRG